MDDSPELLGGWLNYAYMKRRMLFTAITAGYHPDKSLTNFIINLKFWNLTNL